MCRFLFSLVFFSLLGEVLSLPNCTLQQAKDNADCANKNKDNLNIALKQDLDKPENMMNFKRFCKGAYKCFDDVGCADSRIFRQYYVGICEFIIYNYTEYADCAEKLAAAGSQCVDYLYENFSALFNNEISKFKKCSDFQKSVDCMNVDILKYCDKKHAEDFKKKLIGMALIAQCDISK